MRHGASWVLLHDSIDRHQPAEQGFDQIQPQRVLRIALRARRLVVHLEEDSVDAGRDPRRRQRLDVLREPRGHPVAAAKTGRVVNIKKGQFLAPDEVRHAIAKVTDAGNPRVIVTERGTSFGYHNLVVDMRAFPMMREQGVPVVFDVTHGLQLPGAGDGVTIGLAQYIEPLASAGVAAGVDGVFLEVHDNPAQAKSDAQNALRLELLEPLLRHLMAIDTITKQRQSSL